MAACLMFVLPTYTLICIWKLYYFSFCESFAAPLKPKSETSAGHIVWGQRILIIHNEMQFEKYFIGKIASHGVLKMKGSFGWPKVEKVYSFSQLTHIVAYLCGHEQDKCGGGMATTPGTYTHMLSKYYCLVFHFYVDLCLSSLPQPNEKSVYLACCSNTNNCRTACCTRECVCVCLRGYLRFS